MIGKRIFLLSGLFAALLFLASCGSPDKVKMVGVEDFTMVDENRLEVTVRIENRNGNNLAVKAASIALVKDQTDLVELYLAEKVVIPRRSDQGLVFPVILRFGNRGVLSSLPGEDKSKLAIKGYVKGQSGIFSKKYKIGPMPLEEFLAMLDEENRDLIQGFIY